MPRSMQKVAMEKGRCAGIADKGGRVVREPGPMKHGSTVIAFVEDPDGYKVELIELSSRADT